MTSIDYSHIIILIEIYKIIYSEIAYAECISLYFKGDKYVLIAVTLIFATIYVTLYGLIVRFKAGAGNNA